VRGCQSLTTVTSRVPLPTTMLTGTTAPGSWPPGRVVRSRRDVTGRAES